MAVCIAYHVMLERHIRSIARSRPWRKARRWCVCVDVAPYTIGNAFGRRRGNNVATKHSVLEGDSVTVVRYGLDVLTHDINSVVTVGTFDGVHCGHQGIIKRMHETAAPLQSRVVVVTFDPHPQIVLNKPGRKPVKLLTTLEERLAVFESLNVDLVVVLPFTKEFATTPPDEFVVKVLVGGIGMHTVFVGHDHMFGKDRAGNEALLEQLGTVFGFAVAPVPPLECNNIVVSSTMIRETLYQGNVEEAQQMLGRPYMYSGVVVHGDGRGRAIGTPTANLECTHPNKLLPAYGVYVVSATVNGIDYQGVASIGVRPTFIEDGEPLLEVHLFDTDADLYGETVTVAFHRFLRTELRFDSKESLIAQMHNDIQQAQTFFQTHFVRTSS